MGPWTGIALALSEPGDDGMGSRLVTALHPLAGRPLAWHAFSRLLDVRPAPEQAFLFVRGLPDAELFAEFTPRLRPFGEPAEDLREVIGGISGVEQANLLLIDATALVARRDLQQLLAGPVDRILVDAHERVLAAWLSPDGARDVLDGSMQLGSIGENLPSSQRVHAEGTTVLVHDRRTLSRASRLIRNRLVKQLMRAGATFLLPESVLIDVDVRIGRDTVIYPGAILEGQTVIGAETVIGPSCRIIDSWIGSGVELKGWNYIAHTSIRNRAILEPYVRRGYD